MYWEFPIIDNQARLNGFNSYPREVYDNFLEYIDKNGKALDLGCGTGLLLKHIVQNSPYKIQPFGVDFLSEAVNVAQKNFPEQENHFYCIGIHLFHTTIPFDFIIFEPSLLIEEDRVPITERLFLCLSDRGKIIIYSYHDSMNALKIFHLSEYFDEKSYNFIKYNSYKEIGLSIAILQKNF